MAGRGRPFEKGNSGGPGRPKGITFRGILRGYLEQPDLPPDPKSRYQFAAEKLWERARDDVEFLLESMKFLEGPSPRDSESPKKEDGKTIKERIDEHKSKKAARKTRRIGGPDEGGLSSQGATEESMS